MSTSFRILHKIGEGGMGVVFLAIQQPLEREVAIKFLPPHLTDSMRIERFEREVEAAMRLNHPNVVKILDKGNQDGKYYYVMEFLDGYVTLHDHIQARGRLPWKEAVEILVQVLNALECCHERDLLHRDIKPRNIMVSDTRPVKVMDFGLVKLLDAEALTQEGKSMGTPSYMAPERFLGKPETATIDLFSAGCILYEMLAGRRAFPGDSAREVVPRIMKDPTPRLAEVDPSLEPYQPILETFLAKYSEERFATARAARDALERRLISGAVAVFPPRKARRTELAPVAAPASGKPAAPVDPARETRRHRRRQRRRTVMKVMAACVAVSLVLLVSHLALRSTPAPDSTAPVELTVEPGVDRARLSMTTALADPLEIEVTSDKDPRGLRHSIRDELVVTDLAEDTRYRWTVAHPGGAARASGEFRTRSSLDAARDLAVALETADVPGLRKRIRQLKVEVAPGGSMSDWKRLREESSRWIQQATMRTRVAPLAATFAPVAASFFGGLVDPEEKRRLYMAVQPLADLEHDAAEFEIPITPLAPTLLGPGWRPSEPGDLGRAPGLAVVWGDGVPFEKLRGRLSPELAVTHTRSAAARFHSDRRTMRTSPGDFTDQMQLVEAKAHDELSFETSVPFEFPAVTGRTGVALVAVEEATGGNVFDLEIAAETGPFACFVRLRPNTRDFHQIAHTFDARLLAGRRMRLRCRFEVDHHAPGFNQHPRIHYLVLAFPEGKETP